MGHVGERRARLGVLAHEGEVVVAPFLQAEGPQLRPAAHVLGAGVEVLNVHGARPVAVGHQDLVGPGGEEPVQRGVDLLGQELAGQVVPVLPRPRPIQRVLHARHSLEIGHQVDSHVSPSLSARRSPRCPVLLRRGQGRRSRCRARLPGGGPGPGGRHRREQLRRAGHHPRRRPQRPRPDRPAAVLRGGHRPEEPLVGGRLHGAQLGPPPRPAPRRPRRLPHRPRRHRRRPLRRRPGPSRPPAGAGRGRCRRGRRAGRRRVAAPALRRHPGDRRLPPRARRRDRRPRSGSPRHRRPVESPRPSGCVAVPRRSRGGGRPVPARSPRRHWRCAPRRRGGSAVAGGPVGA